MTQPTLISLGSINMDFQVRTDRWPDFGETMLATDYLMTAGGKAANVAVLGHRLGAPTMLLGHVGDDILAGSILRDLETAGIDLRHVRRVEGSATAVSMIMVRPDGGKTITLAPNANLEWDKDTDGDDVAGAIENAPDGSVLVTDLEIPAAIVQRAVEAARSMGFPVVLDPSPADRLTDEISRQVDVVTPNTSEAGTMTGVDVDSVEAAERAGRSLLERGFGTVCQKLGDGGCVAVTQDATDHIAAVEVDVVDQTGAGDAFAGGMGVALLEGRSAMEAARYAVAASHLAVTAYGSQQSYPDRATFDQMLARINDAHDNQARDS